MPEQSKEAAAKQAAEQDLSKLAGKGSKRGPGRPKTGTIEPLAVSLEDLDVKQDGAKQAAMEPTAKAMPAGRPGRPKGAAKAKRGRPRKLETLPKGVKADRKPAVAGLLKDYVKKAEAKKIAKKAVEKALAKFRAGLPKLIQRDLKRLLR
jgi:hypothetical protein